MKLYASLACGNKSDFALFLKRAKSHNASLARDIDVLPFSQSYLSLCVYIIHNMMKVNKNNILPLVGSKIKMYNEVLCVLLWLGSAGSFHIYTFLTRLLVRFWVSLADMGQSGKVCRFDSWPVGEWFNKKKKKVQWVHVTWSRGMSHILAIINFDFSI